MWRGLISLSSLPSWPGPDLALYALQRLPHGWLLRAPNVDLPAVCAVLVLEDDCMTDLNVWHHSLHKITGSMALKFNRAAAADLQRWAEALRTVAGEMEAVAEGGVAAVPRDEEGHVMSDDETDRYREALERIVQWSEAYPLDVFPEPDFAKARELLAAGGIMIDAVSASCMRHVIRGVGEIARKALDAR